MLSRKFVAADRKTSTMTFPVPAPYMRKTVELETVPGSARLTVSALGFYRAFVNGKEITRGHLSPYVSNLDDYIYYDEYDIASLLVPGKNVLAFLVGAGFRDPIGGDPWWFNKVPWRGAPAVAFALETEENGEKTVLEADEDVKTAPSPIYLNDLRIGEFYDARNETPGWNEIDFDDSAWKNAFIVETPRGESRVGIHSPIVVEREIKPVEVRRSLIARFRIAPDEDMTPYPEDEHAMEGWLFDFGENNAGTVRLRVKGKRGQKIVLQFGEILDPALKGLDLRNMHYLPIGYDHRSIYILKGDPEGEEYTQSFTYFGFRYCLAIGMTEEQATPDAMTALVMHSDFETVGGIESSEEMVNLMWKATQRANKSNFFHIPTDCPHREKNGWTGDISLSAEQMLLSLSVEDNLREWLYNVRASQTAEGMIPDIIPTGAWGYRNKKLNPLWDKVLVDLPYFIWKYRGSTEVLRENATAIFRLIDLIGELTLHTENGLMPYGFGDWCPFDRVFFDYLPPEILTGTLGCLEACRRAAKIFDALDMKSRASYVRAIEARLWDSCQKHLVNHETHTALGDCQASQAMAIQLGLFPKDELPLAVQKLVEFVHAKDDLLDVGVIGSRYIFDALSENGYVDLALSTLVTTRYPSIGYCIAQGDTSLPESLCRPDYPDPGSHNHHFFGDCCSGWFIRALGGVHVNPFDRDASEVFIAPKFASAHESFSCWHKTVRGKLAVDWKRTGSGMRLTLSVPEGLYGEIELPEGWTFENGTSRAPLSAGSFALIHK